MNLNDPRVKIIPPKPIYSNYLLEIGDRVVVNVDPETRSYCKYLPDGTAGTIIGFETYQRYYGRDSRYGTPDGGTGLYQQRGIPKIKWDDGSESNFSASHLYLEDYQVDAERQNARTELNEKNDALTKISELPDLPFYEGDMVMLTDKSHPSYRGDMLTVFKVERIDYDRINDKRNDGSPMPIYNISSPNFSVAVKTDEIKLVCRGNHWKHEHGEPLDFIDIRDEVKFNMELNKFTQLRNTDNYYYTTRDAFQMILDKKACYYNNNALYDCSDKVLAEKLQRYYAAYGIE